MKINELIQEFTIAITNEEQALLNRIQKITPLAAFSEREQFIIENLVRKSLISKVQHKDTVLVVINDKPTDN